MSGVTEQVSGPEIRQGSCLYLNNSPCGRKSLNRSARSACCARAADVMPQAAAEPASDLQTAGPGPGGRLSAAQAFQTRPPAAAAAGVPVSSETGLELVEDCN